MNSLVSVIQLTFFYQSLCGSKNHALTDTTIKLGPSERWRYYEFEWMTMRILQARVKIRLYALLDIEWYSHFDSLLMLAVRKRSHSICTVVLVNIVKQIWMCWTKMSRLLSSFAKFPSKYMLYMICTIRHKKWNSLFDSLLMCSIFFDIVWV